MTSKLITAPDDEPVSLADAKLHLRETGTAQDALIRSLIASARQQAEELTRRAFMTQSWSVYLDAFPLAMRDFRFGPVGSPLWPYQTKPAAAIELPRPPVQSITWVKYYDQAAGALQTLDPTLYILDAASEPARLFPAPGASWPATQLRPNAVEVRYVAGYGADAETVPEPIRSWMLLRLAAMYENREEVVVEPRVTASVEVSFVDGLLDAYRVLTA
jgi:uncharacterized phiE125 gp8 family phage protein